MGRDEESNTKEGRTEMDWYLIEEILRDMSKPENPMWDVGMMISGFLIVYVLGMLTMWIFTRGGKEVKEK